MINKKTTLLLMSFQFLLTLSIVTVMLVWNTQNTFSQQKEKESVATVPENIGAEEDERQFPGFWVEAMPQFLGGEKALMKYIKTNIKYPELAAKNKMEGRVVVRFLVSKTGEVKDVTVVRSNLYVECDAEAVRLVEAMPQWMPGKQNGKNINIYYTLPIQFSLKK